MGPGAACLKAGDYTEMGKFVSLRDYTRGASPPAPPRYFCFGKSTQNHLLLPSAYLLRFAEKSFVANPTRRSAYGHPRLEQWDLLPDFSLRCSVLPKSRKVKTSGKLNVNSQLALSAFTQKRTLRTEKGRIKSILSANDP